MMTVFFDVDTQLDFVYPGGALYGAGAERVVPAISRLNRYAAERGIPVMPTTDAHFEDDPEFQNLASPHAWPERWDSASPNPPCSRNA